MDGCSGDIPGVRIAVVIKIGSDGIVFIVTHNTKSWHACVLNSAWSVHAEGEDLSIFAFFGSVGGFLSSCIECHSA